MTRKLPQKNNVNVSIATFSHKKKFCGIHSVRIFTKLTHRNNNWLYSCSKTSMLSSMQEYSIGGVYTNITSAIFADVTASALPLLMCIQKNNTLLTPQSVFFHYLRVYKKKIHTHHNITSWCDHIHNINTF
jgi:hypothetical protein